MVKRNEFGQFAYVNGNQRYRNILINGTRVQEHNYIWMKNFGTIPPGFVVHHTNGNSLDNRIKNLAAMDKNMHAKIHAILNPPWNKGNKCKNISDSKIGHIVKKSQIKKCKKTWKTKYIDSMIKIHGLHEEGFTLVEIAKKLNLTKDQTHNRHAKYMRDYYGM